MSFCQVLLERMAHLVSPQMFCQVQLPVGLLDECASVLRTVRFSSGTGHANAHRHMAAHGRCLVGDRGELDCGAHSFRHEHCPLQVGLRQDYGKLLTSVACYQVASAITLADRFCYRLQAFIARLVTLAIVVELEMVDVANQQRQGLLHSHMPCPFLKQVLVEAAPVCQLS